MNRNGNTFIDNSTVDQTTTRNTYKVNMKPLAVEY